MRHYIVTASNRMVITETTAKYNTYLKTLDEKCQVFTSLKKAKFHIKINEPTSFIEMPVAENLKVKFMPKRKIDDINKEAPMVSRRLIIRKNSSTKIFVSGVSDKNHAGIGVFFGQDNRKVAEKIIGRCSKDRACLYAVIKALELANPNEDLQIILDSYYVINGITKSFKLSENSDLFETIKFLMNHRAGQTDFNKTLGSTDQPVEYYTAKLLATNII